MTTRARCLITPAEPEFVCYLRGSLYPQTSHAMLPTWTLQQVRKLRKLLLTLFYISLLSCPTVAAFPSKGMERPETTFIEYRDKISVRTTGCRSLSPQELRARMGAAFDEATMAFDDESMKRSAELQSVISRKSGGENAALLDDEEDIESISDVSDRIGTDSVQSRKFMRRKRDTTSTVDDTDNTNLETDSQFLYQNMLYDSISKRKSRKRRSANPHSTFHPAWECKKKKIWAKTKDGYFPSRILDGKCKTKSCFFGIYTCNPVRYAIKVLKRDPKDACKPVPLIGQNTTYEESWVFKRISVTVACECGQSWKAKKRKKNRDRSKKNSRN